MGGWKGACSVLGRTFSTTCAWEEARSVAALALAAIAAVKVTASVVLVPETLGAPSAHPASDALEPPVRLGNSEARPTFWHWLISTSLSFKWNSGSGATTRSRVPKASAKCCMVGEAGQLSICAVRCKLLRAWDRRWSSPLSSWLGILSILISTTCPRRASLSDISRFSVPTSALPATTRGCAVINGLGATFASTWASAVKRDRGNSFGTAAGTVAGGAEGRFARNAPSRAAISPEPAERSSAVLQRALRALRSAAASADSDAHWVDESFSVARTFKEYRCPTGKSSFSGGRVQGVVLSCPSPSTCCATTSKPRGASKSGALLQSKSQEIRTEPSLRDNTCTTTE
mmetsp:Transcript_49820/g.132202  ORF Transcript_49820/g.132202 Transcript_49820/m.132202 type:complete len:345 (-) Transcript_49820:1372-2406(-)